MPDNTGNGIVSITEPPPRGCHAGEKARMPMRNTMLPTFANPNGLQATDAGTSDRCIRLAGWTP
ncbi:MAG TPA: hypothetical protein VN924_03175 [Bryobacteraceae bacterium]|nr:hypothetical protein [Bryobacteraceae bacterium]